MPETLRSEAQECSLQVTLAPAGEGHVTLSYVFENRSARSAYLFNQLHKRIGPDGMFLTDPNLACVETGGGGVLVSKKIIPVPGDMDVMRPNVPCTTRVATRERFEERVVLPLPLVPWTPYFAPEEKDLGEKPAALKVSFELAFFLASPEGESMGVKVKTPAGEATHFYPFSPSSQKLLRVGPFSEAVPVRVPRQ